jgi:hypothetical protein
MSGNHGLEALSTREVLALWAAIMRELRRRDVVRTANNPIGDIAEAVVAEHYKGRRESFNNSGWDVTAPNGDRLEVKGIRLAEARTRSNLSPIPATSTYTHVVIVVFDADLRVTEALRAPRAAIERLYAPRAKDRARIIRLGPKLRDDPEVTPVAISDGLLDL